MMTCKDMEQNLSAYLEDILSPDEKRLLEEHLASCPRCRKAIEDLKKAGTLLREVEEVEPPPWFAQKIMSRVREEAKQKEGILRRMFYPLRTKVPIQAFATVLIAVLAFYVYRAGEPQMKVVVSPPAAVSEAGREQAPATTTDIREPGPAGTVKEKAVPKKEAAKDKAMMVPSPLEGVKETIHAEEEHLFKKSKTIADDTGDADKKRSDKEQKTEQAVKPALSKSRQELPKSLKAPSPAPEYRQREPGSFASADARVSRKLEEAPAAPYAIGAAAGKPAHFGVTLYVKDPGIAVSETEALLRKSGARKIKRQTSVDKYFLSAELKAKNLRNFLDKLKTIGETAEKELPAYTEDRDISVMIELLPNH